MAGYQLGHVVQSQSPSWQCGIYRTLTPASTFGCLLPSSCVLTQRRPVNQRPPGASGRLGSLPSRSLPPDRLAA